MFSGTVIPDGMVQAYLATEFHVLGESPFTLRIDQLSPELGLLYHRTGTQSAAFLTAWNPHSDLLPLHENQTAQNRLLRDLKHQQFEVIPGIGRDPSSEWEGEESCLVLGISLSDAQTFGRQFKQNAIVWAGADGVPKLIVLR